MTLLETHVIAAPVFTRWAMARVSADEDKPDIPLIAHTDGIHGAASRGTTPEQDSVLDVLRAAARQSE